MDDLREQLSGVKAEEGRLGKGDAVLAVSILLTFAIVAACALLF